MEAMASTSSSSPPFQTKEELCEKGQFIFASASIYIGREGYSSLKSRVFEVWKDKREIICLSKREKKKTILKVCLEPGRNNNTQEGVI